MKFSKSFVLCLFTASSLLVACGSTAVEPLGITITSADNITSVVEGELLQLTATVYPETAPKSVVWSSSNENLATISNTGLVTTLDEGNVFLYATSSTKDSVRGEFALQITADPNPDPQTINILSSSGNTTLAVGVTLQLTHTVLPPGSDQSVIWTSQNEAIATVSQTGLVSAVAAGSAVIKATSASLSSVFGQITLTVTDDVLPPEPTINWEEVEFTTHAEFMAAENETPIKVKGKVWHITPTTGTGREANVNYYIQNGTEGFYVYAQNVFFYPVEVGKEYVVGGFKKFHNTGAHEVVDVELFSKTDEVIAVTANDISSLNVMDSSAMAPYHGSLVNISSGTITALPSSFTAAYSVNVNVGGSVIAYRVDPKVTGDLEFAAINGFFQTTGVGTEISVKGIMTAFGYGAVKTNQILLTKASDLESQAVDNQTAVELAADSIALENTIELTQTSISLPSSVANFAGVSVTWASDNPAISSIGAVTRPLADIDITLTATFTKGSSTATRLFTVTVLGSNQSNQTNVHVLNFEDALEANSNGNSLSMPSYNDTASANLATLGTPAATWYYGRTLISAISTDVVNGSWSARMQSDKAVQSSSGRLELREDFVFDFLEFNLATYGNDALNGKIQISYSLDQGASWMDINRLLFASTRDFELCRVYIPTEGASARVAISLLVDGNSRRINIDDIRLVKVGT